MELTKQGKIILIAIILALCAAGVFLWTNHMDTAAKLQQATILSQQQAENANVLQNDLKISKQNAEMLAAYIKQAAAGQVQPINYFTVQSPDVQQAAQQVADRINSRDATLPPAALEKTDNTIVSVNNKKTTAANYDVAVFKNNNYRNWEWSAGVGIEDRNIYIPVELQRNYSKDHAIAAEIHVKTDKKISGGELKYVVKTDKLFMLF